MATVTVTSAVVQTPPSTGVPLQGTSGNGPPESLVEEAAPAPHVTRSRALAIISCTTCITAIGNLLAGLLTVCIPVISADLHIPSGLQLWPASAFAMACGCTLLPCGAAADVLGCRRICLVGALLQSAYALGAGLARTPTELIALRAGAGVAASFCLPSAVAVSARTFPAGLHPKLRNMAFASMGGGQALGFGLGLVIGGICADTIGWRWGFYATAILNGAVLILAWWALPNALDGGFLRGRGRETWLRLVRKVDWFGALLISTSLALLSYELAEATGSGARAALGRPLNLVLLCVGFLLLPAFALWMRRQTARGKEALIPNSLWKSPCFTSICVTVFFVWGALNASEQFIALYLQEVRHTSALTSSLYFLPAPITGVLASIAMGTAISRLDPSLAVAGACLVSGVAPLLLAVLCRVDGPGYWGAVFEATALNPLGADFIYTVANLVITSAFPSETQALAGSMFNMLAQIGKSVGVATTMVIARQVTEAKAVPGSAGAILSGYKAGWIYHSALSFAAVAVSYWGLQGVGKLGIKRD